MNLNYSTDNVLAIVLAGGQGQRMQPLTARRAKPALPFAGVYRLIDFPLSNLVHSRVRDVWVIEQFEPQSLNDHLLNGRPWDLDRNRGGLRVFAPHQSGDESDDRFHRGNADALWQHARSIREFDPELVIVCSSDHVYALDLREVLAFHREKGAEVTVVSAQVPREKAGRHGVLQTDDASRVTHWQYKPDEPQSNTVATEVFVYDARVLLETLDELAQESELEDFGHQLLPHLVQRGRAYAYAMPRYWRDVGTIESYWQGHMDLLSEEFPLHLDDPNWPILTAGAPRLPARVLEGARIENSLISPGCTVAGEVVGSILCPGVIVEAGAQVRDCVILEGAHIQSGARLQRVIVDSQTTVNREHGGPDQEISAITSD